MAADLEPRRPLGELMFGALAVGLLLVTLTSKPPTLLLWNPSASAPVGLYRVSPGGQLRRGELVAAFAPEPFRSLAALRSYVPAAVPLVKHVAALEGDRVCAAGTRLLINSRLAAVRLRHDVHGRHLPWWHGCRRLRAGEIFLLNTHPESFDSRYFGPVPRSAVIGQANLLWRR